jgi:hypothetical protein
MPTGTQATAELITSVPTTRQRARPIHHRQALKAKGVSTQRLDRCLGLVVRLGWARLLVDRTTRSSIIYIHPPAQIDLLSRVLCFKCRQERHLRQACWQKLITLGMAVARIGESLGYLFSLQFTIVLALRGRGRYFAF